MPMFANCTSINTSSCHVQIASSASAGNRTRIARMGGEHSTVEPLTQVLRTIVARILWHSSLFVRLRFSQNAVRLVRYESQWRNKCNIFSTLHVSSSPKQASGDALRIFNNCTHNFVYFQHMHLSYVVAKNLNNSSQCLCLVCQKLRLSLASAFDDFARVQFVRLSTLVAASDGVVCRRDGRVV